MAFGLILLFAKSLVKKEIVPFIRKQKYQTWVSSTDHLQEF